VDKANVLENFAAVALDRHSRVAHEFPDVALGPLLVTPAMQLLRDPRSFE